MSHGLKPGIILQKGTYRIEKVLGQGSFGITYLATAKFTTQGSLGQMDVEAKVAIKEFFMSEVNSRKEDGSSVEGSSGSVFINYRKKFRKEAENLSKLSHPNIVKVFDVFDENNTTYYVMKFLEGINLDDNIKQHGFLSESEAILVINEIGNAVKYMHSQNMLHLDIKPKNIMCKPDGKYYLIDFGLAKQFTEDGEPESSTSIGLGTPGYAPIEQSSYNQDGTFPATLDVYALGATLFKMLTGKRPPEATTILNEGFPRNELINSGVSKHLVATVEKAMKSIKKDRYQNIKDFLDEVNEIEEVTIIKPEPDLKPKIDFPRPNSVSQDIPKPTPHPSSIKKRWMWIASFIFIIAITVVIWTKNNNPDYSKHIISESDIENMMDNPALKTIKNMTWDSPLGKAIYSGEVEPDSLVGSTDWLPHGKGVAKIIAGEYTGNIYVGEFEWGKMHGHTTYTQKNGDKFVGTFKYNQYDEGRYTVKSSGEYFEGSFKNGQPYKGMWYNKDGKPID